MVAGVIVEDHRVAGAEPKRTAAPKLETPRLTLRAHTLEDFPACVAMWSDAGVTHFIGGQPQTEEETWARFLRYRGQWALMGYGYWLIEEKASGRFAGEMGFMEAKRAMSPAFGDAHEIGWALMPWAQGKGYATEAVTAAHAWSEKEFGRRRTVCMIAPENLSSMRVAERCGYAEYARSVYKGKPAVLLERR